MRHSGMFSNDSVPSLCHLPKMTQDREFWTGKSEFLSVLSLTRYLISDKYILDFSGLLCQEQPMPLSSTFTFHFLASSSRRCWKDTRGGTGAYSLFWGVLTLSSLRKGRVQGTIQWTVPWTPEGRFPGKFTSAIPIPSKSLHHPLATHTLSNDVWDSFTWFFL